jgi:hypothetical protein
MGGTRQKTLILALCACAALLVAAPTASASNARVNYRAAANSDAEFFFDKGGLRLGGTCDAGSQMIIAADSNYDDALIHYNSQGGTTQFASDFRNDLDDVTFSPLITEDLGASDGAVGQIVYARPGGVNVTIDWLAEENSSGLLGDPNKNCVFTGHARVAPNTEGGRVNFRNNTGPGPEQTFFSRGGLSLVQAMNSPCTVGPILDVSARSSVDDAMIGDYGQYTNDADTVDGRIGAHDPNFDSGSSDEMVLSDDGSMDNNSAGHLVYARSGGKNISVDYAAEEGTNLFGDKGCAFVGSTRVTEPGNSRRVNFRPDTDQIAPIKFFQLGGLKLKASCSNSQLEVFAKTDYDNAVMHRSYQGPGTPNGYAENDVFMTTDEQLIVGSSAGFESGGGGQIVYSRPGGVNVTVDWTAQDNDLPFDGTRLCAFVGTAEKNTP